MFSGSHVQLWKREKQLRTTVIDEVTIEVAEMDLNRELRNATQEEVKEAISRRDFLRRSAATAAGAAAAGYAGRALADYGAGVFTDDFEDGIIHPEWTTQGNVAETGGNLELAVDGTTTVSSARTNAYNDTDQVMKAVFDGSVVLPNNTGYFVQIGDAAGTDFLRVYVRKSIVPQLYYSIADEGGILITGPGTVTGTYTLEVRKVGNSATGWVNGVQVGGSVAVPQNACGSVGAEVLSGSNSYTAKVQSAELQSGSIQPVVPVASPVALLILAGALVLGGSYKLRQSERQP